MKVELPEKLACPDCLNSFELSKFTEANGEVEEGILACKHCRKVYPVIKGVPRILGEDIIAALVSDYARFRDKYKKEFSQARGGITASGGAAGINVRVARGFTFEWSRHSRVLPEHEKELLHVFGDLIRPDDFRGKIVLDAGCGQGRFAWFAAGYGVKEIFCVDFSEAALVARENLKDIANAYVIQADIFHLPFRDIFNIIYSIGVIHHLPAPRQGMICLLEKLKPQGQIFLWVYGDSAIIPALRFLRRLTVKLNIRLMWFAALAPAVLLYAVNQLHLLCGKIKAARGFSRRIPFSMYADRGFHNIWTICFDHLTTAVAHYFKEEELRDWLKHGAIKEGRLSERYPGKSGSSWRLWAEKV